MAQILLLADDSITIQRMVTQTFAEENFEVICASNGEIAIEKLQEVTPRIILADIFMPRKTGYEVCEYVKSNPKLRHIPVILLVGTFEPFDKREASRVSANTYLTKPFETTALVKLVRELLSQMPEPAPVQDPSPVRPSPPVSPLTLDFEKTFQISLTDTQSQSERPAAKPAEISAEDILETPLAARRVMTPDDFERTLLSEIPIPKGDLELEPDEVLISPEEEYVAEPLAAEPEQHSVNEFLAAPAAAEEFSAPVLSEPPTVDFSIPDEPGEESAPVRIPAASPMEIPAERAVFTDEKPTSRLVRPAAEESPELPEVRDDEVLELPPLEGKLQQPTNDDILGIFQLVPIEAILLKQKRVEEALREAMELAAQPPVSAVAEAQPVAAVEEAVAVEEPVSAEVMEIEAEASAVLEEAAPEIEAAVEAPRAVPVAVPVAVPAARPVAAVLDEATVLKIAQLVVERLSEKVIRDIAWEVVPDLVEVIIRQELEKQKEKGAI